MAKATIAYSQIRRQMELLNVRDLTLEEVWNRMRKDYAETINLVDDRYSEDNKNPTAEHPEWGEESL